MGHTAALSTAQEQSRDATTVSPPRQNLVREATIEVLMHTNHAMLHCGCEYLFGSSGERRETHKEAGY